MEKISAEYQVTLSDFRQATYYGLFLRHRTALRFLFAVLATAVLYVIGATLGLGTINPYALLIAAAYLAWGLVLFGGAELGIRGYLKSPQSLIGCTYRAELESHRIRLEVPERKIKMSTQINELTCVFEISSMFLIYTSIQDVYILPHRCMTPEQRVALRHNFRTHLDKKFSTRFKD